MDHRIAYPLILALALLLEFTPTQPSIPHNAQPIGLDRAAIHQDQGPFAACFRQIEHTDAIGACLTSVTNDEFEPLT